MSSRPTRAVFLDRDGTIIEDVGYLARAEDIRLLPQAPQALRMLRDAGFALIVVTNQSAIARGWLTEEGLAQAHAELNRRLAAQGAAIDAFYYCPHLPGAAVERYSVTCRCRKPEPGLFERAASDRGLELRRSYAVGDSERDVEAGRRAGCRTILIARGAAGTGDARCGTVVPPDATVQDLMGAAEVIVSAERAEARGG